MNFIKYNPETKIIDLSTVFTSEQENSICIDGFDTSILKTTLQAKEVDDTSKPIFGGEIVDFVLSEGWQHDENGFFAMSADRYTGAEERIAIECGSITTATLELYGYEYVGGAYGITVKLLWIDGQVKAQKLSGYEKKTIYVLEEDESLKLPQAKAKKLFELSCQSLDHVSKLVPEYKKMNALFAIYPEETKAQYKALMEGCRNEFYRCKAIVDAATTLEGINVTATWPAL